MGKRPKIKGVDGIAAGLLVLFGINVESLAGTASGDGQPDLQAVRLLLRGPSGEFVGADRPELDAVLQELWRRIARSPALRERMLDRRSVAAVSCSPYLVSTTGFLHAALFPTQDSLELWVSERLLCRLARLHSADPGTFELTLKHLVSHMLAQMRYLRDPQHAGHTYRDYQRTLLDSSAREAFVELLRFGCEAAYRTPPIFLAPFAPPALWHEMSDVTPTEQSFLAESMPSVLAFLNADAGGLLKQLAQTQRDGRHASLVLDRARLIALKRQLREAACLPIFAGPIKDIDRSEEDELLAAGIATPAKLTHLPAAEVCQRTQGRISLTRVQELRAAAMGLKIPVKLGSTTGQKPQFQVDSAPFPRRVAAQESAPGLRRAVCFEGSDPPHPNWSVPILPTLSPDRRIHMDPLQRFGDQHLPHQALLERFNNTFQPISGDHSAAVADTRLAGRGPLALKLERHYAPFQHYAQMVTSQVNSIALDHYTQLLTWLDNPANYQPLIASGEAAIDAAQTEFVQAVESVFLQGVSMAEDALGLLRAQQTKRPGYVQDCQVVPDVYRPVHPRLKDYEASWSVPEDELERVSTRFVKPDPGASTGVLPDNWRFVPKTFEGKIPIIPPQDHQPYPLFEDEPAFGIDNDLLLSYSRFQEAQWWELDDLFGAYIDQWTVTIGVGDGPPPTGSSASPVGSDGSSMTGGGTFAVYGNSGDADKRKAIWKSTIYLQDRTFFLGWLFNYVTSRKHVTREWRRLKDWRDASLQAAGEAAEEAKRLFRRSVAERVQAIRAVVAETVETLRPQVYPAHSPLGQGWFLNIPQLDVVGQGVKLLLSGSAYEVVFDSSNRYAAPGGAGILHARADSYLFETSELDYRFDQQGALQAISLPGGADEIAVATDYVVLDPAVYGHDRACVVVSLKNQDGQQIHMNYTADGHGLLKAIVDQLGRQIDFSYMPDPGGAAVSLLASVHYPGGAVVAYRYESLNLDATGTRAIPLAVLSAFTYPSGGEQVYRYDTRWQAEVELAAFTPLLEPAPDLLRVAAPPRLFLSYGRAPQPSGADEILNRTCYCYEEEEGQGKPEGGFRTTRIVEFHKAAIWYYVAPPGSNLVLDRVDIHRAEWDPKAVVDVTCPDECPTHIRERLETNEYRFDTLGHLLSRRTRRGPDGPFRVYAAGYSGPAGYFGLPDWEEWGTSDGVVLRRLATRYSPDLPRSPIRVMGDIATIEFDYDPGGPDDPGRSLQPVEVRLCGADGQVARTRLTFDGRGRPLKITGPLGETTLFLYDANGTRVGRVASDRTAWESYDVDERGSVTAHTDALGHQTKYAYDPDGRLRAITRPDGTRVSLAYDLDGLRTVIEDELGHTHTLVGDHFGFTRRVWTAVPGQTPAHRLSHIYYYDEIMRPRQRCRVPHTTGTTQRCDDVLWDVFDRPALTTNRFGGQYRWTYDDRLQPRALHDDRLATVLAVVGPLGELERRHLDALGQVIGRHVAINYPVPSQPQSVLSWAFWWDACGRPLRVRGPQDADASYRYDSLGRLCELRDELGASTLYQFDLAGRLCQVQDPNGNLTDFEYDELGRLSAVLLPAVSGDRGRQTYGYDDIGRITSYSTPHGHVFRWEYADTPQEIAAQGEQSPALAALLAARPEIRHLIIRRGAQEETLAADAAGRQVALMDGLGHWSATTFDAFGDAVCVRDKAGLETHFEYDDFHAMSAVQDALGNRRTYERDNRGLVTRFVDPLGGATLFEHDPLGRVTALTLPAGNTHHFTYTPQDALSTHTTPLGAAYRSRLDYAPNRVEQVLSPEGTAITSFFNARDELVRRVKSGGAEWQFRYDPGGNLVSVRNPLGGEEAFGYDARSRLISYRRHCDNPTVFRYLSGWEPTAVVHSNGSTTSIERDLLDRPIRYQPAVGAATEYEYDPAGNLTLIQDAPDRLVRFEHTPDGLVSDVILPPGYGRLHYEYDPLRRLIKQTDEEDLPETLTYDALSRITGRRTRARVEWAYRYDANGNLKVISTAALGDLLHIAHDADDRAISSSVATGSGWACTDFSYDRDGRLVRVSDALGSRAYTYDAAGYLCQVVDGLGHTFSFQRNALGQMLSYAAGRAVPERFEYDPMGRPTRRMTTLGSETIEYNAYGQLARFSYPGGQHDVVLSYDPMGRVESVCYGGAYTKRFAYDNFGNLVKIGDGDGHIAGLEYDLRGRVIAQDLDGDRLGFTLSPNGKLLRVKSAHCGDRTYRYDPATDLLRSVSLRAAWVEIEYDALARLCRRRYSSGVIEDLTWTPHGLVQTRLLLGNGENTWRLNYHYDLRGNLIRVDQEDPEGVRSSAAFRYDRNDQLLQASEQPGGERHAYQYDVFGNMVYRERAGVALRYTYDASNVLIGVAVAGRTLRVASDPAGRILSIGDPAGAYHEKYAYDAAGRLTQADMLGVGSHTFSYNVLDQLAAASAPYGQASLAFQGDNVIRLSVAGREGLPRHIAIVPESDPDDVALRSAPAVAVAHQDATMTVIGASDTSGTVTPGLHLDPFGEPLGDEEARRAAGDFSFHGHWHAAPNLVWFRNRWYHAGLKRFMAADPLSGDEALPLSLNHFAAFLNNPLRYRDPFGAQYEAIAWVCQFEGEPVGPSGFVFRGELGADRNVPAYDTVANGAIIGDYWRLADELWPALSPSFLPGSGEPLPFTPPPIPAPLPSVPSASDLVPGLATMLPGSSSVPQRSEPAALRPAPSLARARPTGGGGYTTWDHVKDLAKNILQTDIDIFRDLINIPLGFVRTRVDDFTQMFSALVEGSPIEAAGWFFGINRIVQSLAKDTVLYQQTGAGTGEIVALHLANLSGMTGVMESATGETLWAKEMATAERVQQGIVGLARLVGTAAAVAAPVSAAITRPAAAVPKLIPEPEPARPPRRSKKPLADLKRRSLTDPDVPTFIKQWLEQERNRTGSNSPYKWHNPPGYQGGHPHGKPFMTYGDTGGPLKWETTAGNLNNASRVTGKTPRKVRPIPGD